MATNLVTVGSILSPEEIAELVVKPLTTEGGTTATVAAQVSKVVQTGQSAFRIPTVETTPTNNWVDEGEEIPFSDASFDDVEVPFKKTGGLVRITREAANDTNPEASAIIGSLIVEDLKKKLDAAFFGNLGAKAPAGLAGLSGVTTMNAGAAASAWTNLDAFAEAAAKLEDLGLELGGFVTNPTIALELAKVKAGTGSATPLLATDPAQPSRRLIQGVPLLRTPAVGANVIWALPKPDARRAYFVIREDVEVLADSSVLFTSDQVAVRSIMRVGFGFPHPEAIVKMNRTTS